MTNELLIVTIEQKKALDELVELFNKKTDTINLDWAIEFHSREEWGGKLSALNTLSMAKFVKALYVGYKLNKTKEEKLVAYCKDIRNRYNSANISNNYNQSAFLDGMLYGISKANAIMELGIKEVELRDREK